MPQAKKEDAQVVSDVVDTPEQALAAQQEGFAEAVSSTPAPSKTEKSAEQITQEVEAIAKLEQEASEQAKAVQVKTPVLAGYTEEEVKSALDKAKQYDSLKTALDKVNGKFGGIEQRLTEMAKQKSSDVQMTEEDVAELKAEYGPELATALMKSMNKFFPRLAGNGAPSGKDAKAAGETPEEQQAKIDAAIVAAKTEVKAEIEATRQDTELKFLTRAHRDWRSIVQGKPQQNADGAPMVDAHGRQLMSVKPEFAAWTKTLPAEDQQKLGGSWDADFLYDKIGEYKAHIAAQHKAATEAAAKKQQIPARLQAAVIPRSIPGTATGKTALEEQREGYESA